MPEATSFNIGPSPLNALFGAVTGGVAAGVAAQADDGSPNGFQAMLAAQTGPNQAPGTQAGAATGLPAAPAPVAATMAALRGNVAAINGPDIVMPETGHAAPNMPITASSGNLPVGGKILPVALAPQEGASDRTDPATDTTPDAASAAAPDAVKALLAKVTGAAPRPRKTAAEPAGPDDTPATGQADKAAAPTGDDAPDPEAEVAAPQTVTPEAPTPPAPTPDGSVPSAAAPVVMLAMNPPPSPAPDAGKAAPKADDKADRLAIAGVSAPSTISPAGLAPNRAATAAAATAAPVQTPIAATGQGAALSPLPLGPAAANDAGTAQQGQSVAQAAAPIITAALPPAAALLASAKTAAKPVRSAPSSTAADDAAAPQGTTALHQSAQAALQDRPLSAPDTITDTFSNTGGGALNAAQPSGEAARIAAPTIADIGTGASRDMSALVDRLVETRAAMRSGAPAQWVQTSIQHAEFGRVALQIRQDGDNLSVAMASNDPGFAPAAQAALNGSQSLLQPAAAAQNGADTGRNPDQGAGQNAGQQSQNTFSGGQPGGQFTGQFNGQSGGQNQQPATRQQAPFANGPTAAPQGQAPGDTAGSATSNRSGILA